MPVETVRPPAVGNLLSRLAKARLMAEAAKAAPLVAAPGAPADTPVSLADVEQLLADRDAFWRQEIAAGTAALRGLLEVVGTKPSDEWDLVPSYGLDGAITRIKLKAVRPQPEN